ncbi:unnamed protein product [Leptidea sinapis]|uniref:Retrotransposon gag domain-containing protein n=1 Tax=Leptidea sinapis TaxID=189913 RepID=A0A5E4PY60_9NEOP|nr:unnamed protein product [Leptidea sinapis]
MGDLIPRYNGNPKTLNYYIREVESVISLIEPGWQAHPVLISLIKSRLSGAAIPYENSLDSWPEVKYALLRTFRRNEIQVMQELTRMRRLKSEDAETFGKRLRDILDTLFTVGKHTDKSYYENMVIEHYISQLEFNVGIGVRIMKPTSLELTIVAARQEEAKLMYYRQANPDTNTVSTSRIRQKTDYSRLFPQNNYLRSVNNNPPRLFNPNFVPQQNNMNSQQRQQWIQSSLPWKNSHQGHKTSGNVRSDFGHQPNLPQQNINPTQKVSDLYNEVFYFRKPCNDTSNKTHASYITLEPVDLQPSANKTSETPNYDTIQDVLLPMSSLSAQGPVVHSETTQINAIVSNVASKSRSLIEDVNTNTLECFNSVIAKLTGGKRINFALKVGKEYARQPLFSAFNTKSTVSTIQKAITSNAPGGLAEEIENTL